jgi:hypothetical protein
VRRRHKASAIDRIKAARNPVVIVPFHGEPIPVVLRELTQAQILACGEFSLIETFQDKINKKKLNRKTALRNITEYAETAHALCKKTLVKPTYDEIVEALSGYEVEENKKKIAEIDELLARMEPSPKRTELQKELNGLRIWAEMLLPEDFTGAILSYVLGIEKSDIKEITEDALLNAAVLAERGRDNPADHIHGEFTDYMRDDINRRAWIVLEDYRKERRHGHS